MKPTDSLPVAVRIAARGALFRTKKELSGLRPRYGSSLAINAAVLLDNNVLASDFGLEQIEEIVRMGIAVDFNQGLDARRACDDPYILDLLARVKWIQHIRFACDRISQLEAVTTCVKELGRRGIKPYRIFIYCLIQDVNESLERINALRKLKVCPFAQPYRDFDNNIEPTKEQKRLARWCNHKAIFKSVEFKNYRR